MKDFFKSTGFKILVLVASFLVGFMIYAASVDGIATIPGAVSGAILTPLQSFFSTIGDGLSDFFGGFGGSSALREENAQLQAELNELREQQVELDELRRQNELYKGFLELKEQNPDYKFVDARVIATDPTDIYGNFTIGVGSLGGVSAGNAVITPEGLVGVVYETGLNFAKVRTILDPDLQISAYDSRTREDGITGGSLEQARQGCTRLNQLERSYTAGVGDYVVTYGGKYPSGLLIGEITELVQESDGLSTYAVVKPFANISAVSHVFVITEFAGQDES